MVPASPASRPVAGILWMLVSGLCFVGVTAVVKHVGETIPGAEAAFLRYAFGTALLLPAIWRERADFPRGRVLGIYAARGAVHTVAVLCWFFTMTQLPIAEVTALNYVVPIYVTIGAALFLGERLSFRRISAVCVALVGALMILRPGVREIQPGHFAMMLAAACFAASYVMAKLLSAGQSASMMVAMLSVTVAIGLVPFAWAVWVTPTPVQLAWLLLVALFATSGHFAMMLAFKAAPITVTQPATFMQLVWAVLLGFLVFHEPVDGWVIAGGATIMSAVTFITWREARSKRRQITPPDVATRI